MKGWEVVIEIKHLLSQQKSVSHIARRLGIDRKTVRKYRDQPMDEIADRQRVPRSRSTKLDRFGPWIEEKVKEMAEDGVINAQSVFHELQGLGYRGSARSVRRFVSGLRRQAVRKRVYQPFETPPGHQAMVDLGEKRQVRLGGERRTVHIAAMVLSHSRRKYAEWFDRPVDTEAFIRFHQRAFQALGGVPRQVACDQTKLAVIREEYGEVDFNRSFFGLARWCGFEPYICRKHDPETKGKIESTIRYLKRGFLPGRSFDSLADLDGQCVRWLEQVADAKVHETTGRVPLEAWEEEIPCLQRFQPSGFHPRPAFRLQLVHQDGLAKVLGNRYSVPWQHHGRQVKVRITEEKVEMRSLEGEHLCTHWRCLEKGKRFVEPEHYRKPHEVPTVVLTQQLFNLFQSRELIVQLRRKFPRHYRDQCRRLLSLQGRFEERLLRQACGRVLHHDCASYKNLKQAAEYLHALEPASPAAVPAPAGMPADLGMESRRSDYYDELLREAGP